MDRTKLNRAYYAAARAAGMDDEARRDMLEAQTGHRSSKACTDAQMLQVLDHLNGHGGAADGQGSRPASRRRPAGHPLAAKARALWISLHELGAVTDPSETALNAWVKRTAGVDDLAWMPVAKASAVVDGLKGWLGRYGVNWLAHPNPRRCILLAQWHKLRQSGAEPALDMAVYCSQLYRVASPEYCTDAQLDRLIRDLGKRIRTIAK